MNQAKYQIGDRAGAWVVVAVEYLVDLEEWTYCLERDRDCKRLRCTQSLLDRIVVRYRFINKLT